MRSLFFLIILSFSSLNFKAQDTISIMYYNLLNFPETTANRVDTLKKIIQYTQPDVLVVNELQTLFGANLILTSALNTGGVTTYAKALFYDGPDTDNMIFYNTQKLGLSKQYQIVTQLRDISEYKMFYKSQDLATSNDTTFIWFYSAHLKAGSTQADADQRGAEAQTFKNYLTNNFRSGNMVLGGDFNFYTSSETGCQTIMFTGNQTFRDPINRLGAWNNNANYKDVHTQSTRTSAGYAGGSTGGLDDRFDIIFLNDNIINAVSKVSYVPNSYKAIGQDHNRFNGNVNDGINTAVPAHIANALFYMSDHLPVYLKLALDHLVGVQERNELISNYSYNHASNLLTIYLKQEIQKGTISIVDISGRQVYANTINTNQVEVNLPFLNTGIYIVSLVSENGFQSSFKWVKY